MDRHATDSEFHSYGKFFMYASREIRKLDAMNKSPLFGLYSETISGLDVIRAYKRTSPVRPTSLDSNR